MCSLSSEIGFIATIYDVCIFQDELEVLRADVERYNEVIEYLRYFVSKIEEMLKYQENLYINSDDILEHLRNNKKDSLMLKNILDDELIFIKKYCKDIMEDWKYYKEFIEICKIHRLE